MRIASTIPSATPSSRAIGACAYHSNSAAQNFAVTRTAISRRLPGRAEPKRRNAPSFWTLSASPGLCSSTGKGPNTEPRGPDAMESWTAFWASVMVSGLTGSYRVIVRSFRVIGARSIGRVGTGLKSGGRLARSGDGNAAGTPSVMPGLVPGIHAPPPPRPCPSSHLSMPQRRGCPEQVSGMTGEWRGRPVEMTSEYRFAGDTP